MTGIYIHIPYCRSKCIYCDFYSLPHHKELQRVIDGLVAEYAARRLELTGAPDTLYIGGGTPSILSVDDLARIVTLIQNTDITEFTIEANPDDVTRDKAEGWRRLGVNRVSMGVQTFDDDILRTLRRRHTSAQVFSALDALTEAGITNISCDLIYGLPGQTLDGWQRDLDTMMSLPVTHLSAYCLTVYPDTPLWHMVERGKAIPCSDDTEAEMFAALRQSAARNGFEHYEISNLARPGFRSRHNSSYWDPAGRWLGLGPSAYSYNGTHRRYNAPDISRWLSRLPDPAEIEDESPVDQINDLIVAGLRTLDGLDLSAFDAATAASIAKSASPYLATGEMRLTDSRLAIDPDKWLVSDVYIRNILLDS